MINVVVVQARMASSRFPGKHLAPLAGLPMIDHVINRIRCTHEGRIIVATTTDRSDDPLAQYVEKKHYADVFRGSANNPLERMYNAVRNKANIITRITGDTPLVDLRALDRFVRELDSTEIDYIGCTNSPDGNDIEVFRREALEEAYDRAKPDEVEHTTTWIRKNLKCESTESDPAYSDVHYSVNTVEDLKMCERMIERVGEGARWQDYVNAYRELHK